MRLSSAELRLALKLDERHTYAALNFAWEFILKTNLLDRITIEPGKCGGRPCIRGMRIRVNDILEMLGDGVDMSEILTDFPDLERDDILACLQFAARRSDIVRLAA